MLLLTVSVSGLLKIRAARAVNNRVAANRAISKRPAFLVVDACRCQRLIVVVVQRVTSSIAPTKFFTRATARGRVVAERAFNQMQRKIDNAPPSLTSALGALPWQLSGRDGDICHQFDTEDARIGRASAGLRCSCRLAPGR